MLLVCAKHVMVIFSHRSLKSLWHHVVTVQEVVGTKDWTLRPRVGQWQPKYR